MACILVVLHIPPVFGGSVDSVQASPAAPESLLLEIMDLHAELVTDADFVGQAKMLGAYLEAAQSMDAGKKARIYERVLSILLKIKASQGARMPHRAMPEVPPQIHPQKPADTETTFTSGGAVLEVFRIDPEKTEKPILDIPVVRTQWSRGLSHKGLVILPQRQAEIGKRGTPYAAKFSFYYHAKQRGKYAFTILQGKNYCGLQIGDTPVIRAQSDNTGSRQEELDLESGFHRMEFVLVSAVPEDFLGFGVGAFGSNKWDATFEVRVLPPDGFDSVPITRDMMLLKKAD